MDNSCDSSGAGCSPCSSKSSACKVCFWLIAIGGINWGLVGLGGLLGTDLNVVNMVLGGMPALENLVYLLVGVATTCKLLKCKK